MPASPRAWRLWLGAFVMFAIAFGLSAWVDTLWEQCDDAYITYQYARRLASGEGFTFSPGAAPSYGTTTPLWTLILAAIARAGIPPHVAAPWLTSIGHGATAALAFLIGTAAGGMVVGLPAGLTVALGLAVFFRTGGMETALVTGLSAALAYLLLLGRARWWPGALIGLLAVARPDAAILGVLVLGGWLFAARRRRELFRPNLVAAVAVYLPWAVYAVVTFHDIVPFSMRAKLALKGVSGEMNAGSFIALFAPGPGQPYRLWIAAALAAVGGVALWRREPRMRPFVVWVPVHYIALAAGGAPDFMWYYVPPLWMGFILLYMGIKVVSGQSRAVALAVTTSALLLSVGDNCVALHRDLLMNPNIRFHRMLAQRVSEVAEPGDLLAAREVGHLAYWTGCSVLDMLALTCPEVLEYAKGGDRSAIIREWEPDLVALHHADGEPALQKGYVVRSRHYYCDSSYVVMERTAPVTRRERGALLPRDWEAQAGEAGGG